MKLTPLYLRSWSAIQCLFVVKWSLTNHFLCASVGCDGSEGEDAVVQGSGVGYILQHNAKQLQQLLVVRFKGLGVRLHNLAE